MTCLLLRRRAKDVAQRVWGSGRRAEDVVQCGWKFRSKSRDIGRGFKAVLYGSTRTTTGFGIIVSGRFRDSITGHFVQAKDEFWSLLDEKKEEVPSKDIIIVAGDLNEHDRDRSIVTDAKEVVPYETVAPQYRPLVCTLKITPPRVQQVERCDAARMKWWRMREKEAAVISRVRLPTVTTVDETWKRATDAIRQAAMLELGTTEPARRKVDRQTWLWTDDVKAKI
ncbi:unnamed protein product [Heligmosomoides polygyrus]|uniref:Endo/exonuclease/phosphatase domain-containing protein n=1 Tax=Heligmosomoides polygyrus TaxID=6339 RepID=A0A183FEY3_HELPZ|nr:unnamed protein product [Heligmosomoides polygyrus]